MSETKSKVRRPLFERLLTIWNKLPTLYAVELKDADTGTVITVCHADKARVDATTLQLVVEVYSQLHGKRANQAIVDPKFTSWLNANGYLVVSTTEPSILFGKIEQ